MIKNKKKRDEACEKACNEFLHQQLENREKAFAEMFLNAPLVSFPKKTKKKHDYSNKVRGKGVVLTAKTLEAALKRMQAFKDIYVDINRPEYLTAISLIPLPPGRWKRVKK